MSDTTKLLSYLVMIGFFFMFAGNAATLFDEDRKPMTWRKAGLLFLTGVLFGFVVHLLDSIGKR